MEQAKNNIAPDQLNRLMRDRLMATGIHQEKPLGSFNLTLGGTTRIKLQNIGITHRLRLLFTLNATIATATATLSPFGLFNSIPRIRVDDFDGQPRCNVSAAHLLMRNSLRERRIDGASSQALVGIGGSAFLPAASALVPNIGLTAGAQIGQFFVDVPIAVDSDAGDLRGAILTQSTVGEVTLSIDAVSLNGLFGNADDTKVFNNTATVSAATMSVEVVQEFILPQNDPMVGGVPIPQMDIMTVYELVTQQTSDNLSAGAEKMISLPNSRLINALYYRWFHNSIQGGSSTTNDLTKHRILVNGTTPIRERSNIFQTLCQRQDIGSDLGKGAYFQNFIGLPGSGKQPVQTAQMGNVQLALTPATSPTGTTFVDYALESMYVKGVALGSVIPGN